MGKLSGTLLLANIVTGVCLGGQVGGLTNVGGLRYFVRLSGYVGEVSLSEGLLICLCHTKKV